MHKTCPRCEGSKITQHGSFVLEGKTYPARTSKCYVCDGAGSFPPVDREAILKAIRGRKGLCTKRPDDRRAYYVWRMARFHGGADVTMPMTASMECGKDPFRDELDTLADTVARQVYGSNLAAAHRWGRVLGHVSRDLPGLPATAYLGGPVADEFKPRSERLELK